MFISVSVNTTCRYSLFPFYICMLYSCDNCITLYLWNLLPVLFYLDGFSVEIQLSCNILVPPSSSHSKPQFVNILGGKKYVFEFQTSLACAPQPVDCVFADPQGKKRWKYPLAQSPMSKNSLQGSVDLQNALSWQNNCSWYFSGSDSRLDWVFNACVYFVILVAIHCSWSPLITIYNKRRLCLPHTNAKEGRAILWEQKTSYLC